MEKIPCFDAHCDTIYKCRRHGQHLTGSGGHVAIDLASGLAPYAQVFALFYDTDRMEYGTPWEETRSFHECYLTELARCGPNLVHCASQADVRAAVSAGKTAALLSIEDGALLECDPGRLETAAGWGVIFLTVTWNHRNLLSGSCADEPEQGLTDLGRAFVREAERLKIRMDVSHISPRGFWDLAEFSQAPIVATHSNSAVLCPHPRNLSDDQFRTIAQSGGVVGLNYYRDFIGGSGDIPALIAHLERFLSLGGEDSVGLGSDFDGCSDLCRGLENIGAVPRLYSALKDRGYGDALLRKLFFENWMRLLR